MGKSDKPLEYYLRQLGVDEEELDDPRWLNFEPISEPEMRMLSSRITVCELLRQIHNETTNPVIKIKCRMATTFAKWMAIQCTRQLGKKWGRAYYPWNPKKRHKRLRAKYGEEYQRKERITDDEGGEDDRS